MEYSVAEIMGWEAVDLTKKKKIAAFEDWWVECQPVSAGGQEL